MTVPVDIYNDEELEVYTNALFELTALENPSRSIDLPDGSTTAQPRSRSELQAKMSP